jgi:hypothetical protein
MSAEKPTENKAVVVALPRELVPVTSPEVRLKRQIRDHFNKNIHDLTTLLKVAEAIGYINPFIIEEGGASALHRPATLPRPRQIGHNGETGPTVG